MAENDALTPQTEREKLLESFMEAAARASGTRPNKVLVVISSPEMVEGLVSLAARLCRPGDIVVALKIVLVAPSALLSDAQRQAKLARRFRDLMQLAVKHGEKSGVKVETVLHVAYDIASGIVESVNNRSDARLLLLGWSGPARHSHPGIDICKKVMRDAQCDVTVFLDRGLTDSRRVLVPVGGGPHARLGLRLAADLVKDKAAELVVLRVMNEKVTDITSEQAIVEELIRNEMGKRSNDLTVLPRVTRSESVVEGILDETKLGYDLLVIGASEEGLLRHWLFGSIPAAIASRTPCSMLLVRKYESSPVLWIQRVFRHILGSRPRIKRDGKNN